MVNVPDSGDAGGTMDLPPPPKVNSELAERSAHYEISKRQGVGTAGQKIPLLTNHFDVLVKVSDAVFYQYDVSISSEDNKAVEGKEIGRKVIDRLHQIYSSELEGKSFAYDGEKNLYTVGPLAQNHYEFTVVLEKSYAKREESSCGSGSTSGSDKRSKRSFLSKVFKVDVGYATKIPLNSVALALKGAPADNSTQDALRVLDIILRQQAAKRGCLLVRQSFFHDDSGNFTDVGGGVTGVRGFHSSFRLSQGGLSLNLDVSTTMILKPGPVIDFLIANQNVGEPRYIDWMKARKMLKNVRIKTSHRNMEYKIIGLSEKPCKQQFFSMKMKKGSADEGQSVEITVYEYFSQYCGIELTYSAHLPCLDVGQPNRPNYLPLELCSVVSLQRYTKALSSTQRASLVEKSRQKPKEKIEIVTDNLKKFGYEDDPLLTACGITIDRKLIRLDGRVLEAPKLKMGGHDDFIPRNGRWNFNNKKLLDPIRLSHWALVNFSARCDISYISRELINCARNKGLYIERPHTLIEEDPRARNAGPVARVEKMFDVLKEKIPGSDPPTFILCVLPEKKNSDIYGPWKKKCLCDFGIFTQCMAPYKINDQYLSNLLLKINSKLGGVNSLLAIEHLSLVPVIKDTPTIILGIDVSHGSTSRSDYPSIAAVVGSQSWPLISRYRAAVRTQSPKLEMVDTLYKPLANGNDDGIIRELLVDFYATSKGRKPTQIILFRDGVSESQFNQVLNIEVDQIIKAYQHLGEVDVPKFTVIIAQKNHHTRLFQAGSPENVPPGTVVDTKIVHPRNYDFFMCAQAGMIGTSRPVHYHVLVDEIGFSPDGVQNLINSLSYVYQRSTCAISIVAPICYAHLAAHQMGQFVKFEEASETSSGQVCPSMPESVPVPELPRLCENVRRSMFFC